MMGTLYKRWIELQNQKAQWAVKNKTGHSVAQKEAIDQESVDGQRRTKEATTSEVPHRMTTEPSPFTEEGLERLLKHLIVGE